MTQGAMHWSVYSCFNLQPLSSLFRKQIILQVEAANLGFKTLPTRCHRDSLNICKGSLYPLAPESVQGLSLFPWESERSEPSVLQVSMLSSVMKRSTHGRLCLDRPYSLVARAEESWVQILPLQQSLPNRLLFPLGLEYDYWSNHRLSLGSSREGKHGEL